MTFAEIRADALDIIQDWQQHGDYTVAKLNHYINLGNRQFAKKTKCISGSILITTAAQQLEYTQADQATLQYLYIPRSVRYIETGSELGKKLDPYPGGYHNLPKDLRYGNPDWYVFENLRGRSITTAGTPTGSIIRTGVKFYAWPIVSATGETFDINGYLFPATLSADSHTPEYDESWHDAITHYAAFRILRMFSEKFPEARVKALEQKALFDEFVADAKSEMGVDQFAHAQVLDWETEVGGW
jgi:hypothetical protein